MRWTRRFSKKPVLLVLALCTLTVFYLLSSSSHSTSTIATSAEVHSVDQKSSQEDVSEIPDRDVLDTHRKLYKHNQPGRLKSNELNKNDQFNDQYLKKRAELRKDLIDSDIARKQAAVDIQKSLSSNKNPKQMLVSDEHNPLNQIKLKKLLQEEQNRQKKVQESTDTGQQRKLLVDKLIGTGNQKGRSRITVLGEFAMESYLEAQKMVKEDATVKGDAMKNFQFNQIASDALAPDRYLKDYRNSKCQRSPTHYQSNLPPASVIICFHNEARSALLRTIVSVLTRSPSELIQEIILVDDFSNDRRDGKLLQSIPKVVLIRLESRHGLIKARLVGTERARGPVVLFLDSHCEATTGWLEPLLSRIKANSSHVVSPVIDILSKDDMSYTLASPLVKGGFGSNLHFKWDTMTSKETRSRSLIDPIRTPAIAGGLFAVDKKWFEHIGLYDRQMEIWGGENIGHIFRSAMPYSFGEGGTYHTTVTRNIRRTVEVWLDSYKPYYYEQNPFSLQVDFGDISERQELRQRLHCKSFQWFLDNVYPQFDAPPIQDFTYGQLRSIGSGLCLDSRKSFAGQPVDLGQCLPPQDKTNRGQLWAMYSKGGLKQRTLCLSYMTNQFSQQQCNPQDTAQSFQLQSNGLLVHTPTRRCLATGSQHLTLVNCNIELNTDTAIEWDFILS